ncbi:hypothetical protein M8818_007862 [Zalaria obscura]|uniref:Uncharacterized protein n=1 Tax=Zalaria obscura TaxID=2024903 RepID=A0ACC3S5G3_9PEZI
MAAASRSSRHSTAGRLATASRHRHGHRAEDKAKGIEKPDIDQLRRARASFFSRPPRDRIDEARNAVKDEKKIASAKDDSKRKKKKQTSEHGRPRAGSTKRGHPTPFSRATSSTHRPSEDFVYGPPPVLEEDRKLRVDSRKDDCARAVRRNRPGKVFSKHRLDATSKETPKRGKIQLSNEDVSDLSSEEDESDCAPSATQHRGSSERTIRSDTKRQAAPRPSRTTSTKNVHSMEARPVLKRSNTTSHIHIPLAQAKASTRSITAGTTAESASTAPSKRAGSRQSSLLGSLFGQSHTTTSIPVRKVDCLTCGEDDVPITKSAKLACGHRMCHSCLKRVFTMSVTDPAHMPPKCCTSDHVPLKHVEKLFSLNFKILWNKKYQEYTTKNRIYCPTRGCGEWISPNHIRSDQGRKYGKCSKCRTKVCALCNGKWHTRRECPKDEETKKFAEIAKEKGWQKCFNCKATVELKEGCNHMTCRCTAEFCMLCGSQWKTCDCPWFNHTPMLDDDRLQHMRVPEPINNIRRQVFAAVEQVADQRRPRPRPDPARTYQEEMDARQAQERADETLARRLQLAAIDSEDEAPARPGLQDTWGVGNAAEHFINEDFIQNAANVVMAAFGDAMHVVQGERPKRRSRRTNAVPAGPNQDQGASAARDAQQLTEEGVQAVQRGDAQARVGEWLNRGS